MAKTPKTIPASAHSLTAALSGAFIFGVISLFFWPINAPMLVQILLALAIYAVPVMFYNFVILKSHRNNEELVWNKKNPINWDRTYSKLLALLVVYLSIAFFYWLLPIYREEFYGPYMEILSVVFPSLCLSAIPYVAIVDSKMKDPKDSYYHFGQYLRGKTNQFTSYMLKQLYLGWLVKAFFLPLMVTWLAQHLGGLKDFKLEDNFQFIDLYKYLLNFAYLLDVLVGAIGYMFTFKLINTHIRSTESTVGGWVVTILCYPPFIAVTTKEYFPFPSTDWADLLVNMPTLTIIWGSIILILSFIYLLATVCFGLSFSNITYRGLISTGCYKWTKHPAYLSKNLSWWFLYAPFLANSSTIEIIRSCIMLLGINFIYYLRAKTEERHLMQYAEYREYCEWMNKHGVVTKHLYRISQYLPKFTKP